MSNIWKFSSFSKPLVKRLHQTAKELENDSKWSEKFKHLTKAHLNNYNVENNNDNLTGSASDVEPFCRQDTVMASETEKVNIVETNTGTNQNFCDTIEADPLSRLEYMMEECIKSPNLIINFAEKLSVNAIDKICNAIFTRNNISIEFITLFFQNFFPKFLKREQSWIALDLLFKAYKTYPEAFKSVLIELIKDISIPNTVLQEFIQNSDEEMQKNFIATIIQTNITSEMFIHHLYTLYSVYKDCNKTENIQNFVQSKLIENAPHCTNEKNYGRLFLTFLQAQKFLGLPTDHTILERVIELHRTPFKRPCLTILNEIVKLGPSNLM